MGYIKVGAFEGMGIVTKSGIERGGECAGMVGVGERKNGKIGGIKGENWKF
jgi:hypothetical protein